MFSSGAVPDNVQSLWPWLKDTFSRLQGHVNGYERKKVDLVWTVSGGAAPAFGNSVVDCYSHVDNDLVEIWASIVFGSTATFGGGAWRFALPKPARVESVGTCMAYASAGNMNICGARAIGGILVLNRAGTPTEFSATVPFAWGAGDLLWFHIRYPI